MNLFLLAWRNIFRQKRRTLITLSALVIGLAGLVIFQGYLNQTMLGFRDSTIRNGLGHLQVAASQAYYTEGEFNPYSYALTDSKNIVETLEKQPGVIAVFPSTGFTAIAGAGDKSTTLLVKGFPAEQFYFDDPSVNFSMPKAEKFKLGTLKEGVNIKKGQTDNLILGETAARILKVKIGDVITLMAVLPNGGLNGRDFTVTGIYAFPGKDKIFAYTDYASAMDFTAQTQAPVIHVLLKDPFQSSRVAKVAAQFGVVKTWQDLATYYLQVNSMFQGFLSVIRLILLLITLFILYNTMNRLVLERMQEWGTLRAMGTKKSGVLGLIVLEGTFQGLLGGLLGIGLGFVLAEVFNLFGGLPFSDGGKTIHVLITPDLESLWQNLIPVVLTGTLAAFFPAVKAMNLTPAECLRQI